MLLRAMHVSELTPAIAAKCGQLREGKLPPADLAAGGPTMMHIFRREMRASVIPA